LRWWGIRNLSTFCFAEKLMRDGNSTKTPLYQNSCWAFVLYVIFSFLILFNTSSTEKFGGKGLKFLFDALNLLR
jgi:hypothetical protein